MFRKLLIALCIITFIVSDSVASPNRLVTAPLTSLVIARAVSEQDVDCLAKNIYFEARNQSIEGQFAVAEVVINRMNDSRFPSNVCKIIKQKTNNICQFSWYCDGKSDKMMEKKPAEVARMVAVSSLFFKTNFTKGAIYYHSSYVKPKWSKYGKTTQIQDHVFYDRI